MGGLTAYNMAQKVTILGVDELQARACHGVSAETVAAHGTRGEPLVSFPGRGRHDGICRALGGLAGRDTVCFLWSDSQDDAVNSALVQRVEVAGQSRQCTQRAVAEFAVSLLARFLESNVVGCLFLRNN